MVDWWNCLFNRNAAASNAIIALYNCDVSRLSVKLANKQFFFTFLGCLRWYDLCKQLQNSQKTLVTSVSLQQQEAASYRKLQVVPNQQEHFQADLARPCRLPWIELHNAEDRTESCAEIDHRIRCRLQGTCLIFLLLAADSQMHQVQDSIGSVQQDQVV